MADAQQSNQLGEKECLSRNETLPVTSRENTKGSADERHCFIRGHYSFYARSLAENVCSRLFGGALSLFILCGQSSAGAQSCVVREYSPLNNDLRIEGIRILENGDVAAISYEGMEENPNTSISIPNSRQGDSQVYASSVSFVQRISGNGRAVIRNFKSGELSLVSAPGSEAIPVILPSSEVSVLDINDDGTMVGGLYLTDEELRGFILNPDGGLSLLEMPDSFVTSINSSGQYIAMDMSGNGIATVFSAKGAPLTVETPYLTKKQWNHHQLHISDHLGMITASVTEADQSDGLWGVGSRCVEAKLDDHGNYVSSIVAIPNSEQTDYCLSTRANSNGVYLVTNGDAENQEDRRFFVRNGDDLIDIETLCPEIQKRYSLVRAVGVNNNDDMLFDAIKLSDPSRSYMLKIRAQ